MKMSKFVQLVSFLVVIAIAIPAVHSQQDRPFQPGGPGGGYRPGGDQQGRPQLSGGQRSGPPGAFQPGGGQFGGGRGGPPSAVPQGAGPFGGGRGGPPGAVQQGSGPGAVQQGGPFGGGGPAGAAGAGNNAVRNQQIINALKAMDANNDGRLDPGEVPEARRPFVQMMAQRLGVNPNGPIDLRALERSAGASAPAASSGTRPSTGTRSIVLPENPLVPYFGEVSMAISTGTTVLAFGQRERTAAPTPMYDPQNPRGGRGQQVQNADIQLQQTMKAARDLLTRNDKNRNGTLDRLNDEWNGLPFDANAADKNKDGRLTLSEIIAALGGRPGANLGSAKVTTVSGSYQDRMPEGVPDWFTRMDANKDGQITLFEYAEGQPFTDEMINEFKANDVNGDGIITIEEAYAFMKRMDDEKRKKDAEAAEQAGNDPTSRPVQRNTSPRQPQGASSRPQSQSTSTPSVQNPDRGNRGNYNNQNNQYNQRPQRPDVQQRSGEYQQGTGGRPQGTSGPGASGRRSGGRGN